MFYYVQYDAGKKGAWELLSAKTTPSRTPAFRSILQLSGDPDEYLAQGIDPEEKIKYLGPAYFDLDGPDIGQVVDSGRDLVSQLIKEHRIPEDAIRVYLSGKKGLHILVHEKVFGLTTPKLFLPHAWLRFAKRFDSPFIDTNVYSLLKGRMWRCCGVQRPDNGKYKVPITLAELKTLTAEGYDELVSQPRPEFAAPDDFEVVPTLNTFLTAALESSKVAWRAQQKALGSITVDDLRNVEGIPGCIQKLITEGDCPESSWNQASMQLAGYIAARYDIEEEDEYMQELVTPFVTNVHSSSRPSEGVRRAEMRSQLRRAFSGRTRFSAGGIIKTLGRPCGGCVICTPQDSRTETKETDLYDSATHIKITDDGVFLIGENNSKLLLTCRIEQKIQYVEYDHVRRQEIPLAGDYYLSGGELQGPSTVTLEEGDLLDKRRLSAALATGGAAFAGSDSDLTRLQRTLYKQRRGVEKMIQTRLSGVVLQEKDGKIYPHLVTRDAAYRKGATPSEFEYHGPASLAPSFKSVPDFLGAEDVQGLETAMDALLDMNDASIITPCLGWVAATHIKPFLTWADKSFPLLSLSGTSETGKSATAYVLLALNGFPYRSPVTWNAETDTLYPLEEAVTSSTTFARLIEEVNEHQVDRRTWKKLTGVLKNAWDEAGIGRGVLSGRKVTTVRRENPAPLIYLSEQPHPVQAIRTRSVECMFTRRTMENPRYAQKHETVVENIRYLEMFAKVLATTALNSSFQQVEGWRKEAREKIPKAYVGRALYANQAVLSGLIFLRYVMETYSQKLVIRLDSAINAHVAHLEHISEATLRDKRYSNLDEMLSCINLMASEYDNPAYGLVAGEHYWKDNSRLFLDMEAVVPRYRRYIRSMGMEAPIKTAHQATALLETETYYRGSTQRPDIPAITLRIIHLGKLEARGVRLAHMRAEPLGPADLTLAR